MFAMKISKYLTIKWRELVFILFLSIFSYNINAQEIDSLIIWDKNYKLRWGDFLGNRTIPMKNFSAISSLEIYLTTTYYKNEVLYYTVIPLFNRNKSVTRNFNDQLLEHERLHFDILELFARKIRKEFKLLEENNACENSYLEIFNEYRSSLWLYQNKYDIATKHSLNQKNQQIWNVKISKELNKLEAFSIENLYNVKVKISFFSSTLERI